jgi:DNA-directed RNA polymerase subunit K/omega
MKDYKKTNAPDTTITFDRNEVEAPTENIYKAISIIAKRANQISQELKEELIEKLDEFATHNDSLEEVFENKEQIEVSRFYEKLPKSTAIAVQEWLDGEIYYRTPEEQDDKLA